MLIGTIVMILILFLIINNLYLFFLISLARGLSVLSIFSETHL